MFWTFAFWLFGFVSSFEFRISCFIRMTHHRIQGELVVDIFFDIVYDAVDAGGVFVPEHFILCCPLEFPLFSVPFHSFLKG